MIKRGALLFSLLALVFVGSAGAQTYTFVKLFPDSGFNPGPISGGGINNCLAVDGSGKVWIASYRYADSIQTSTGSYIDVRATYCFNPNGSQASFSPLNILTKTDGSEVDTLNGGILGYSYGYGMITAPNGNIYAVTPSAYVFEIDPATGKFIQKAYNPIPGYSSSIASCAVDDAGELFLVPVISGPGPIAITSDFSAPIEVVDTSAYGGVARDIAVSGDGNDVFVPYFAGAPGSPCVYHYHSDVGTLGAYSFADTLFKGLSVESCAWQPVTGWLWLSAGGTATAPSTAGAGYSPFTWYAFDMSNPSAPVMKDSLKWNLAANGISADSAMTTAIDCRGIAFSPTGDTAYVAIFNSNINCCQMFTGTVTAVHDPAHGPSTYALSQNYPNPFNPSTKIEFTLKSNVKVSLKVYDILGREVATLVDGRLASGDHSVTFNANNLASGVYLYSLATSDGFRLTRKMILMK